MEGGQLTFFSTWTSPIRPVNGPFAHVDSQCYIKDSVVDAVSEFHGDISPIAWHTGTVAHYPTTTIASSRSTMQGIDRSDLQEPDWIEFKFSTNFSLVLFNSFHLSHSCINMQEKFQYWTIHLPHSIASFLILVILLTFDMGSRRLIHSAISL